MGFFGPSQSKRAALDARHAAKLAEIQSKFAAEEAERARLDAEEEATYLRKLELLSRNALFDAMTEDDLDALAGVMRRVEVKAGKRVLRHEPKSERDRASKRGVVTSLFGAGKAKGKPAARAPPPPDDDAFDRDEAFYVVDSGSLDVSVADEGVAVTLHPGDAVGELDKLFLAPRDRSVTVVANVDAVLWAVPGRTLRRKRGFKAVVAKAAATRAAWDPLLVAVPLLASALTPFQRAFLTAKLRPRRFESHEPVATEDEEARECWMLMEGECAATPRSSAETNVAFGNFSRATISPRRPSRVSASTTNTPSARVRTARNSHVCARRISARRSSKRAAMAAADAFVAEMAAAASRGVLGLVDDAVADEMAGIGEPGVAARPRTPPTPSPRRRGRDESATEWLAKEANARANRARPRRTRNRRRSSFGRDDVRGCERGTETRKSTRSSGRRTRRRNARGRRTRTRRRRGRFRRRRRRRRRRSASRARLGPDARSSSETAAGTTPEGDARLARLLACLEAHPLFEGAERRALRAAVAEMELRVVPPGGALFPRGPTRRLSVRRRSRRVGRHRAGSRGRFPARRDARAEWIDRG